MNHITINKYTHLGDSIDYFEVMRFQKVLGDVLDTVLKTLETDSPVYTFLEDLIPPSLKDKAEEVAKQVGEALSTAQPQTEESEEGQTLSLLVKQGEEAIKNRQFDLAKSLFNSALIMSNGDSEQKVSSNNTYLIQRLAYATYKSKQPDEITALKDAIALLNKIDLAHTNDSETVILAGAMEKRLFQQGEGDEHVNNAILYFQRGFYLLNNRYNGINLAFLLNSRAATSIDADDEDKIADMVWANRIRRDVLVMCEHDWNDIINRQSKLNADFFQNEDISQSQEDIQTEQQFWILVNKAEAHFGLGNFDEYKKAIADAQAIEHDDGMMKSFTDQRDELRKLLQKTGNLLAPPWHEN